MEMEAGDSYVERWEPHRGVTICAMLVKYNVYDVQKEKCNLGVCRESLKGDEAGTGTSYSCIEKYCEVVGSGWDDGCTSTSICSAYSVMCRSFIV